jgi:hypothetical protein
MESSTTDRRGAPPGVFGESRNDTSHIGASSNRAAQDFEGQIDWVTWKAEADYSGGGVGPNY